MRRLKRIADKSKEILLPRRKYNFRNTVLVVGTGRSGTTWLIEAMNSHKDYRIVFEPFHHRYVPRIRGGESSKPYHDRHDTTERKEIYQSLLTGDIDNKWTNSIKSSNRRAKHQIVKEIRLNKMLAWIQQNFPDLKIVIIVRDPFSTAFSSTEKGWMGAPPVEQILPNNDFAKKYFTARQLNELKKANSTFQKNIASWTIENYLLLKNTERNDNVISLYYESLVSNPETELKRIAQFCGHKYIPIDASKKSHTAHSKSVVDPKSKKFGRRWEGEITKEDQKYAETVLKAFGLDTLYKERNVPAFKEPLDWNPKRAVKTRKKL